MKECRVMREISPEADVSANPVNWNALVDGIRAHDPRAMEDLYALFGRGIRFYLHRQVGAQELQDKIHDIFVIVVQAIRRGELREPERLMGFVRTIAHRQVVAHIDDRVHERNEEIPLETRTPVRDLGRTPEDTAVHREKTDVMARTLRSLPPRDREILERFYLKEQTQEQICAEMRLTDTQFRLLKSRAKARFGEHGQKRIRDKRTAGFVWRAFSDFTTNKA
jgi:RNA polymerase sigma factor (sigma-70 family)